MKKYEFTGEIKKAGMYGKITVKRIRDTVAFGMIKAGDLGGWIEREENLSYIGNAWVGGDAEIYGNAAVCGNAKVYGNANVYGNAEVYGNAMVCGNAEIF